MIVPKKGEKHGTIGCLEWRETLRITRVESVQEEDLKADQQEEEKNLANSFIESDNLPNNK